MLRSVIDRVAVPVAAFDAALCLILANQPFAEMFDLPPELAAPGTAFDAIIRHNWARGLYGAADPEEIVAHWRRALTEGMADHDRIRRPDGRVYVVEREVLPSGGWVLTYIDLTETTQRQEALEASQARYRGIVEDQTEMISRFDADCTLTFVNRAYCDAFGFTHEELIGRDFTECIPDPETRVKIKKAIRGLSREKPVISGEYQEKNADGSRRWRHWVDRALFDSEGNIVEYQGVGRDTTKQRDAEDALKESEARYRGIVEDQTEFIMRFQPQTHELTFINSAYCRHIGMRPEEIIGRPIWSLMGPDLEEDFRAKLAGLTQIAPQATTEISYLNADSVQIFEQWTDRAIFDEEGQVVGYQSVGRDVTDQAIAREALTRSERRFKGIAETHPVPVVIVRQSDMTVLYASPAAAQLLRGAHQGVPLRGQALVFEDDGEAELRATLAQVGQVPRFTTRLKTAETFVSVEIAARQMDFDGIEAIAMGVTDITERLRVEAEIQRQREALAQSEKMSALGSLLASVAHELNNPLAVILAQAEIASEFAAAEADRARAERIQIAAERCSRIVKTFLAMARQKPPSREQVDLNLLTNNAVELMRYALSTAGVEVVFDLAEALPPVAGDPDQLTQVVINLLINAQQAMAAQAGSREVRLKTEVDAEGQVTLTVADTGPGVPREVQDRIFEPFFTTKEEGAGTGIGLSVCTNIAQAHGGTLSLGAAPGAGAVFVLALPEDREIGATEAAVEGSAPLPPLKILAVDDEAEIGISIAEMLVPLGHEVVLAMSAQQALDYLASERFDVILSDIRMPGMDGLQFHRALVAQWPAMAGRIAFITGDTMGGLSRRLISETGCLVLEKPFDRGELTDLLRDIQAGAA